ncbi:MAG: hypothetical protein ACE5E2_03290 [Candidatus Binatia bacterium]
MLTMPSKVKFLFVALLLCALLSPPSLSADDLVENAGVGIGVTAGNLIYVPFKVTIMVLAVPQAAFSWLLSGGNDQLTKQFLEDTLDEPYFISTELARFAVGESPDLDDDNP